MKQPSLALGFQAAIIRTRVAVTFSATTIADHCPSGGRKFAPWTLSRLAVLLVIAALFAPGLLHAQNGSCVYPPPGLVSWWSGDGNANDIFGGNPGRLQGGATIAPGMVGQAFNFDGTNAVVRIPNTALDDAYSAFTIESWVLPTKYAVSPQTQSSERLGRTVVSKTQNDGFAMRIRDGYLQADLRLTGGDVVRSFTQARLPLNIWSHVAVTCDGSTVRGYLNGQFLSSAVASGAVRNAANTGADLMIGNEPGGHPNDPVAVGYGWPGSIDEVSFYNRALSSNEVQAIYAAGSAGKCKPAISSEVTYAENFEGPIGPEWSNTSTDSTPVGSRRFLGRFAANQAVTLTRSNLPPHTNLTVTLDLLVIDSWDGNDRKWGRDLWEAALVGGPILLRTTFQNNGSHQVQAFPENDATGSFPAWTGALEIDTLGYSLDSVYRLTFSFPHSTNLLKLLFRGTNLQDVANESWGIDNIVVTADGPTVALTSPTNGAVFVTPTNLVLSAEFSGSETDLKCLQFMSDHVLLGTVTNSPYTLTWSNVPAGIHVLTVRATDQNGKISEDLETIRVNGLRGEYFTNTTLSGLSTDRRDPLVAFNWAEGSPIFGVGIDNFSARWTGQIVPRYSGLYTFYTTANDGVRLWIDGVRLVDDWKGGASRENRGATRLIAGTPSRIQLDYFELSRAAAVSIEWFCSSPSQLREVVPASHLFPPESGVNRPPNAPVITSPSADGWVVDPLADSVLIGDFFSDPDTGQTPASAEWEIWTVGVPSNLVWFCYTANAGLFLANRLSNGGFTNSHSGLTHLLFATDYRLRIRHKDDSGATNEWGPWGARYFNTRGPTIVRPPRENVVIAGGNYEFGFTATNIQPVTIQWFHNGTVIPSATNATLMLTNIQSGHSGGYTVEIRNPSGSATSAAGTLLVDTNYITLAASTFYANAEGWRFWEGDPTYSPHFSWRSSGGYPDGSLFVDEYGNGDGDTTWWWAPTSFLGNKSGAYGGYLEFDLRLSARPDWGRDPQVILWSPHGKIVADSGYDPGTNWTHFRMPLAAAAWHVSTNTGPAPTEDEFLHILATLTSLLIRAEYLGVSYDDNCYLDNPRIVAPLSVSNTILVLKRLIGGLISIEWPTNATNFQLEATDDLSSGIWTTNLAPVSTTVTNGLVTVTFDTSVRNSFFRLRKP